MRNQRRPTHPMLIAIAALMTVALAAIPRLLKAAQQPPVAAAGFAINDFGLRLLSALRAGHETENTIISPVSIAMALEMIYNGAAGNTYLAMGQTLRVTNLGDSINPLNQELLKTIKDADPSVEIAIANALWAQKGFKIAPDFIEKTKAYYGARIRSLNFEGDPDGANAMINRWVDKATKGKIPTIIEKPDPHARLVVTDAVYFKGKWSWPFPKGATATRDFNTADGGAIKTPMMRLEHDFGYLENDDFQAVRLPYGNQSFAMYVLLPKKQTGLAGMVSKLNEVKWRQWGERFVNREGTVVLPKFKLTYQAQLNDPLRKMGMDVAFSDEADFSRVNPSAALKITDVEHRTFIKVDETGTEAAAATSVSIIATAVRREPPPFEMIIDHPFFLAITEGESGAMLFAGVVTNPAAK